MLLFIVAPSTSVLLMDRFQYISCCYLSCQWLWITSSLVRFQYISCCYLSCEFDYSVISSIMFQYISCCYLSQSYWFLIFRQNCFNTSHVAIYHRSDHPIALANLYVSIHLMLLFIPRIANKYRSLQYVSIHLMLLFIDYGDVCYYRFDQFQYISCCYLSFPPGRIIWDKCKFQYISCCYLSSSPSHINKNVSHVSIHLMLLFIMQKSRDPGAPFSVSIHLMLLFISVITWRSGR